MSKKLYTLNDADGALLRYDGVGWASFGSFVPSNWPTAQYRTWSMFVYMGNLYSFYYSNTASPTLNIGLFTGTDITLQTSLVTGLSSNTEWRLSNWVNYRGIMVCVVRRTVSSIFNILTFDGTTLTLRAATEMGTWNTPVSGPSFELESMRLFVHDTKLFLEGRTNVNLSSDYRVRNWYFELDIQETSVTASAFALVDPNIINIHYSSSPNTVLPLLAFMALENGGLESFSLNGNLYRISPSGKVFLIEEPSLLKTLKFDIRDAAIMQYGDLITTADGNINNAIVFNSTADMGSWWPHLTGSKVTWGSYIGTIVYSGSLGHRVLLQDGSPFPTVPLGETITVTKGLQGYLPGSSFTAFAITYINSHIINGIAYIIVTGRQPLQATLNIPAGNKTFCIKYDGVNPPDYYELLVSGNKPNCWGMTTYRDPEDDKIHLLYADGRANLAHHAYFDVNTLTWTYIGSLGVLTYHANRSLISQNGFFGYNDNEGDSIIISATPNVIGTQMTIVYKLYSNDSHPINIAVNYDNGDGSQTATSAGGDGLLALSSSPGGTEHTFIHDNLADLSTYTGAIQYRIQVLP